MSLERTNQLTQIATAVIMAACAVVTVYLTSKSGHEASTPPGMETPTPVPTPKPAAAPAPAASKKKPPLETSAINPKPQPTWLERFFNYIAEENRKAKAKCVPYATDNPFYCDR